MPPLGSERALTPVRINTSHISPLKSRINEKENVPPVDRGSPLSKKRVSFAEHQTRRTEGVPLKNATREHPGFKEKDGVVTELTGLWPVASRLEDDCNEQMPLNATPPRKLVQADPELSRLYTRRPAPALEFDIWHDKPH